MEVIRDLDGVIVRNLDSKNGIIVASQPIGEMRLRNGLELLLGSTVVRFEEPADDSIQSLSRQPDLPTCRSDRESHPVVDGKKRTPYREREGVRIGTSDSAKSSAVIRQKAPLATADILVYLVAAIITLSSIVGLVILLSSD
jgi:hypothetical protein